MTAIQMEPAANETTASCWRRTQEGRKITYHLTVEQQPERARACGQGAKSSSDRRPVDPPPIVKLVVAEGEDEDHDITFEHRTNFLLYATLEEARPIAQPRGVPQTSVVLTGTPVAGVSYLEKPTQGGYFVFSDLSVRHEGFYRLIFSLFEEVKRPEDLDPVDPSVPPKTLNMMYCRCEVKSAPFKVYSAKKFPGLLESTEMSKVVSDQGCRVRIRRDVRMRRRESKDPKSEWANREDSTVLDKDENNRKQEQDQMLADLNNNAHSRTFPEPTPQTVKPEPAQSAPLSSAANTNLSATQHLFVQPPHAQVAPVQSSPTSEQHQPSYHQQSHYDHSNLPAYYEQVSQSHPHASHYQPHRLPVQYNAHHQPSLYSMPPQSAYEYPQAQQSTSMRPQPPKSNSYDSRGTVVDFVNHTRRESYQYPPQPELDRRTTSLTTEYDPQYSPQDQQLTPVHEAQTSVYRSSSSSAATSNSLPPLKALDSSNIDSAVAQNYQAPTQVNGNYGATYQDPNSMPRLPTQYLSHGNAPTSGKRAYGSVFNTHHIEEPLHSGARPDFNSVGDNSPTSDDEFDLPALNYRRADGRINTITWDGFAS